MASNDNQNTLQVIIDPVLDPNAVTNVTEDLKQRVSSGQAYIEDLKQYYASQAGDTPVYDVFIAPLEKFSNQLLEIADSLNKGLDSNKLGAVQQKISAISSAVGELDSGKIKQTATMSMFDKATLSTFQQFTTELQRIAPSRDTVNSIMQSDLGKRMVGSVAGGKVPTLDDANVTRRYLKMVMPSIQPRSGFRDESVQQITNVADYLPAIFQSAQMDTKSLQKSFSKITKKAIDKNLTEQIAAITAIPDADRTQEQTTMLARLKKNKRKTRDAGKEPILNSDFSREIFREFETNKRFAKVLIDAGIATKDTGENIYRLPMQLTRSMLGNIAAELQKNFIGTVAGYNSPDLDKIVNNPFEYNTDAATLAELSPAKRGRHRMVVARGGYENAQGVIQGMNLMQRIHDRGASAFIVPGVQDSGRWKINVPNVTRDLYRYQKYNVSSEGLSDGGTVLYQGSEAIRFLNRYGDNSIQRTMDSKGAVTPGIVVVDADSFDFDNDEKAREHFGNLAYGMDSKGGHYSFATMHRGDEGQHVTLIRDDIRDKAVTVWRKEQAQNYQNNADTNVLWQRGESIANGKKLSYEEIQKLKPYDRAAYQIYASTAFASPFTAYSQVGVKDMPDNATRAKTEDAINKIFSPSTEITGSIKDTTGKALDSGLTFHFVRDEDKVSTLNGTGGGLIGNNGAVYLSSNILPQDSQMRGLWGALKGMGISIQADANGDIYSALKQAGLLDKNGQLMIGGRDVSHGLGIITESSLKTPSIKEALSLIEEAADENGMIPGADGNLIPYQAMQDHILTQFALSGDISAVARTIDKKNESGKIGAQFMSHLIPSGKMIQHQTQMWRELDELAKDPDKALAAVFPSENGDTLSRELHELKKERDENPENILAAQAFADRMASNKVQNRIRGYVDSRKREMAAGNYFDPEGLDKDSQITQGFLGTSFIQRVLTSARASEENKDLTNLEVVKKTNNQLFNDAIKVADWEGVGLEGLSDKQKQKVTANALLMENMFAGFSEDELKELRNKGLIPENLEDNGFVFDPQSKEFKLGYHRDPSTKKDVMTRYNGAYLLRGLEKVKGKSFEDINGQKYNRPYASMFRNTIAGNPKDWEFLASADEDGDAIKRFSGLYYTLLKSDVDANAEMEKAALQYYSDKYADVQVKPIEGETPEDAKANLIARMARSGVARAKMAQFSGQDSRVAQLGLTAEMLADPNNKTALAFYKGMMRSAQLYDYATTYEKKPLEILMQNEDFKATALGAEYGKGVKAVTEALTKGNEAYEEGKRQLKDDENADEFAKIQDYVGDDYYIGKGGVTLDKGLMSRIDQFNLPSAFQANILSSILSRSGTQYNVDEDQTLRDFLINDEEHGLGFENAIGEAEKNFLKAKRGFFVDYYTGKRTGAISDEEMAEFRKLQILAEKERENYIDQNRTSNPDTMKVNGQIVKISKWAKDHNKAIGYTQGKNIDLFGMTNANIAKALAEGMYFEDDARAQLMDLWTGAVGEQKQTLTPIEHPTTTKKPKVKKQAPKAKKITHAPQASEAQPVNIPEEPPRYTAGDNGIGETPNMYTKEDGFMMLKYAQKLEEQGRADEAETMYQQAEEIIRSTTVSGHTMSTLAGQDQFNSPIMAYGKLYGISSPEDTGVTSQMRKDAGDMMESLVLNHLNGKKTGYHFVDPLDVFGTDEEKMLTGEARVDADKALRRKMAFNYFTPGQKYNGLTINGQANPAVANKENLRGMWDSLMVDDKGNVRQVLEMKTMGLHRFLDMAEGRNTDRRYFDEHGVPYAYKIQGAAYANAMGLEDYAIAMTGLTDKDRRELEKAKKNPNYKPQVSPLGKDNFHVQQYRVSDFEIPDVDTNGNFLYEENEQGEKQLKMLRGVAALHALQSRNEQMLNGELAPDDLMNTSNKLLGARQAIIANRLYERGIIQPKSFIPISSPDELAALASSPTSALAISNGDVGALITEILGKVTGMPMALEQRQAVGEIGKNLLSETNNFNANMRKEIFKNNDVSSSQSFMNSTQAQIEDATNMLNTLKSDESIKKILSEQPNTQGAELLSNMLKTLETSVGNMVDNRISAAIARGTRDVENAQKSFEETIKGKDGTESQRKSFETNQRSMQNINDMIELIEASADDDGLTAEQRAQRKAGAENLQKQADELRPLYLQANAMLSKTGIDALDEAIGKQIQSPQEAAEKKIAELTKKAYGQGKLLLDTFKQGGLTEDDFKQGMARLFGTGWEGLSDEDRNKLLEGNLNLENAFNGSTGGALGTIQGRYRDELFGKIRRDREARTRNGNKAVRANEARLMKKTASPEELEEENRYLEHNKIRDMLEQYRNTFAESKNPEEQAEYLAYVHALLGDNANETLAERFINEDLSGEELARLGGQYAMIEPYVRQITQANRMKTARSVRQMNRAARKSRLAINQKIATPEELANEMRENKENDIYDALQNARDRLNGVDDEALMNLARNYLGDDITREGLDRFLQGNMSEKELARLGGQYGALGDYENTMRAQQARQMRLKEMSANRRDRYLRRTIAGRGMSPEEQAQIAKEDMAQQMRENLEQRRITFGQNSPQFQQAIQKTLGEKATKADAMAFLNDTATPEQIASWGGDYSMLENYGNYIQNRAMMQREGAEMSLDQLIDEKRLLKMQQNPFASTWGVRMMMQGVQQAQKKRNLNYRIRQAKQQLSMLNGENPMSTGSSQPQSETETTTKNPVEANKPKMSLAEVISKLPTNADDAYNGAVFYGKDAKSLSENQQAQIALIDGFAQKMGVQVGIHDTLQAPDGSHINGMFDPTSNKIDLALDAEGNLITRTMGHEMMHYIRNNSEEDYKKLMATTKNILQSTPGYDYEARVQEKLKQYNEGKPEEEWITRDEAEEEVGADAMWDVLSGKDTMNELQKHSSLGNAVAGHLGDYANTFHEMGTKINNPEVQAMAAQNMQATEMLRAQFFLASENAAQKKQEAMGPNQRKRYSMQDTREKPKWMNDTSNPYVFGDYVFVRRAKRDDNTGKYSANSEWVHWTKASKNELANAEQRVAFKTAPDFEHTGRIIATDEADIIARQEAFTKASAAKHTAEQNAKKNAEKKDNIFTERIAEELENASDDKERKIIAKRAIRELKAEKASYKIDNKSGKHPEFVPGKNADVVDRDVKRLREKQREEWEKDEANVAVAKQDAKAWENKRTVERAKIAAGEIQYPEAIKQKQEEIEQKRQINQERLKTAQAEANQKAELKKAENLKKLQAIEIDTIPWYENRQNERDSSIKQATDKAMQERRDLLGENQKEEASLRAEKADMQKRYKNKNLNQMSQKTAFKNEQERSDMARYREINKRLEAIGRENTVLSNELDPTSDAYKDVIRTLPEVVEANAKYDEQKREREATISYLKNDADKDVEKERNLELAQAEAAYKKENLQLDQASSSLGKQYDLHTKLGQQKKKEELDVFDAETVVKQAELDKKVKEAEENLATRNYERELELEELKAQKIYDPDNSREGIYLVDQAYQGKLEEKNRDKQIESLKAIAKTGKRPQDDEDVTETTNNASGAIENATNAVSALGDAAQNAAAKLNEENDAEGNDAGGNDAGGNEEQNVPTPTPTPQDTGSSDDQNFRTTRWGRRVERRRHDDGRTYTDDEETQADRSETRETARVAIQDVGKSVVRMGSQGITNFARGIFNSAVNEAKSFVQQYDALMNEIQTITLKTNDEMSKLGKETVQQALELKASVADVATIKADLYRQGLGDDEVNERMEQVVQFSKVTGIKASESVQIVTTAMNTGLADSAQQAMDVLTALGDAAATTADQIQKGIQKAGSSAKVAGVSYEELATLMTIGTSKTQLSGQQIGTALQTIFGRMNKVTQSNYISDLEGGTTSLNDVESALGIVGVKLREDSGSFRSSYDVLRDLAGQWGSMNDTQKSLVTNAFAGTRQSNIFQTLMEGMSEDDGALLDEYLGLAENSEGTTQTKYEIAMQSLSASMEQVKTAWDAIVQTFVDNGTITSTLESVTNFLTKIASAAEDGAGKFEVFGSVVIAALAGIATAIAAVTIASATGATALATFAGPLGWLVGVGLGVGALSLIGAAKGQNYDSKVSDYKDRADTRIEQTMKAENETNDIIDELKSLKEAYDSAEDKNAFETENGDKFNSLLIELNKAIPAATGGFENLSLSSKNLADALDKAADASEQKTEQDIKNIFGEGLSEAYALMGNYFQNRTSSVLETTYEAFGSKGSADEVDASDYNLILGSMFGAGTTAESGLKTLAQGNYTEFQRMMQAYAKENGLTEINPEDIWDIVMNNIRAQAETGTLDFSNMNYQDSYGNTVDFGEYMRDLIFEYTRDNLVVDQSGNDIIDSALDMFMAYVSSEMLPDGMTTDDVRSFATKMLQANSSLYSNENGYNPNNSDMKTFANLVLQTLFNQIMYNGTGGFAQLSQYDTNAGENYAYTMNTSNWASDGLEDVDYGDGRTISNWYKNITDDEGNSHRLYFNRSGGKQEVLYKDSDGNIKILTNTNNKEDLPEWLLSSGLVNVNEESASENALNNSETYTTLSALGINLRSNYDKNGSYLAMVQKGLTNADNTSFTSLEDFNNFMDATSVDGTLLSQVIGGAISGDKSGASLAAFQFATTEAGQAWMAEHGDYLTKTFMNASSDNAINTAGLAPLFDYVKGEGASKSFAELETDESYQDLMQNLKTQLGDDMYQQLEDGSITWDQAMSYLDTQHEANTWASYTDQERDLHTKLAGYEEQMKGLGENTTGYKALKGKADEAQKSLNMLFTAKEIRNARKYGDQTEEVASFLEETAKGGRDASNAVAELTSNMATLSNKKAALAKLKANGGKKDDDAFSILGISKTDFKLMKDAGTWDDYLNQYEKNLVQEWNETVAPEIGEMISADLNGLTIDEKGEVNVKISNVEMSGQDVLDTYGQWLSDEVKQKIMEAGASATFTTSIENDGNGNYTVTVTATDVTGHDYSGGGGGGGGKSVADELVDKQKKNKTEYEHMVKMVQYQQTKYQNANELGNYGLMIEKEIEVEKKRLPVIEDNIKALKEQIAQTAAESDDWYTLRDAILEAEEEYEEINNTIEENIKKLEENQQAIYKLRTDLEDTVKEEIENRKSEEEDMLSGSVSMQETILEAIKQRYQDEWDLVKKDIEKKKQALEEEKSLIDERLQKRKDAADEQEKYEELAEYKKQLALISMDSTRTKDAAELREKIADLEEEIGWDIAEAEAEQQTNALQDEIDAYDDYETEGDEKLEDYLNDANNFADEVNSVLKMTQEEMFNWMKTNVQDYVLSLNDAQLQMVKSWEDTYKQMYGIVDTYWSEINGVLTSKDTFLNYMKNSSDYINASEESRAQMLYNWEEAYDNWAAAQKKDADYAHSDDYGEGSYSLPYNTPHYDWNETLNEIATSAVQGYNATANAQLQALKGTTLQSGVTLTQTQAKQLKALLNASSYVQTPNFSTVDTAGYGNNNSINIDEIQIVVNEASFADEDDYDAFALKVGDAFVKQLSKRGITTANYSF